MKISNIETTYFSLPRRRSHTWATSVTELGSYVVVKLYTDDGLVGLGESPMLVEWAGDYQRYYGESPRTVKHVIADYLLPAIEGEDIFAIERIHEKMDRVCKGHFYAKAGIDIALYDAMGKALGTPVYNLLGGCYRRAIPLVHSCGIMPAEKCRAEAETALKEGIRTIKLKVGLDEARDLAALKAVREVVGPDIDITVDANQAWPTAKRAIQVIRRMEEYGVAFVEQPCDGLDKLEEVAHTVETPIMADESAWTPYDLIEIARRRAVDLISLYTTKPGGLFRAKKVAAVAEAAGLPCNLNGSAESGVGNAANLHLVAATKIVNLPCVLSITAPEGMAPTDVACHFYTDDVVTAPFEYKDGCLIVPDKPGLGIELDEKKLQKYRID
jgi:L-alanine-DL-glutamate epimerase-like enolase superfamily enzyme